MKMQRCYNRSSSETQFSGISHSPQIKIEIDPLESSGLDMPISSDLAIQTLAPFPSSDFPPPSYDLFLSHGVFHPYLAHNPILLGYDSFVSETDLSSRSFYQLESVQSGEFSDGFFNTPSFHSGIPFVQPLEQVAGASETLPFLHLPPLSSPFPSGGANRLKRPCINPPITDPKPSQTLDSFVKTDFLLSSSSSGSPRNSARIRRQRIGDKTRSMQKLMPWDKKMDTATFLEEAHKYIKFLQTQDETMRWMPIDSAFTGMDGDEELGFLGKLNRQQLLQVVLNSPGVQNVLYSRGLCVFSHEQLVLFKHAAMRTGSVSESSGAC